MELKNLITIVLQVTSMVNGLFNLDIQNQGNELEEIPENRGEFGNLPNETQLYTRDFHPQPNQLSKMQDDDPRHPYSAHKPEKFFVPFPEELNVNNELKDDVKDAERDLSQFIEEINNEAPNRCREFSEAKDSFKTNKDNLKKRKQAIQTGLRQGRIENSSEAQTYVKMINRALKDIRRQVKLVERSLSDCKKLENAINPEQFPSVTTRPLETGNCTISSQNTFMEKREKLSSQFKKVTEEINNADERKSELDSNYFLKKNIPEYKDSFPQSLEEMLKELNDIAGNKLPKLKFEQKEIQSEIIKEKDCIESLVKTGKITPLEAQKNINEYEQLINTFDNERNKRETSSKQKLSEKLASVVTNNQGEKLGNSFKRERTTSMSL